MHLPMLTRYRHGRSSALAVLPSSSYHSATLKQLTYHSPRLAVLAPLSSAAAVPPARRENDPIVDVGVPTFLTTVELRRRKCYRDLVVPDVPSFPEKPTPNDFPLISQAFELCRMMPAWDDPQADIDGKQKKTVCLQALLHDVFARPEVVLYFTPELVNEFFAMLAVNLFRGIPPVPRKFFCLDAEPAVVDIAWPHLALVYGLLIRYLTLNGSDGHFSRAFAGRMIELLHAPDANEREQVSLFFLRYVAAYPDREQGIWGRFADILCEYRQGFCDPFPVVPILSFFEARFRELGYAFLDVQTAIYEKRILPLVSGAHLLTYQPRISAVVDIFIERNQAEATKFVRTLIGMYPAGRFSKQVQFIQWIIGMTGRIPPGDFPDLAVPLFALFQRLALSNSSKVVEASFKIWSDEKIIPMIIDSARKIYPGMHDAIFRTMNEHWKPATQQAASIAIQAMQDVDPFVFDALKLGQKKKRDLKVKGQSEDLSRVQKSWAAVVRAASRNDKKLLTTRILVRISQFFSGEVPTIQPTSVAWYDTEERRDTVVERKY